jgi:threonyl-tRNA synthetase
MNPRLPSNDHREIAQRLDLFHFQEDAPGMVFWHPRGYVVYRLLEEAARRVVVRDGYAEVRTPQVLRKPIWQTSGHWDHFRENMFLIAEEDAEAALKPVSCPAHAQIVGRRAPSYRELPLRLAEFGLVHRDERSGTLHGLLRLRQFTQDDGHIFCAEDQAEGEIERFCRSIAPFYAAFGFADVALVVATRPTPRAGDDALWDRAEAALIAVAKRLGIPHAIEEGGGAFYGPKIEFRLSDVGGRVWSCGTIQFDFFMPERFDLRYVSARGEKKPLVMLHRAIYGSLERFLAILLEQHGAALPAWLAPDQVVVVPVHRDQEAWAHEVGARLGDAGLRARVDAREESLARRVALAHQDGAAHIAVVGPRETAAHSLSLRDGPTLELEAAAAELTRRCRPPALGGAAH